MSSNFAWLIDWIKLSPRYLLGIAIASAFLLFATDSATGFFGLTQFRQESRQWIGLVFLLSTSLVFTQLGFAIWRPIKDSITSWNRISSARQRLHKLTPAEKEILRRFIKQDTRTQNLNSGDGVAVGLTDAGIIQWVSDQGSLLVGGWPHNISSWAWDYLRLHPSLLQDNEGRGSEISRCA